MNRKLKIWIFTLVTLAILIIITLVIGEFFLSNIGGVNYLFLPFQVKMTSCGSSEQAFTNCTYPLLWKGIIFSVI